MNTPTPDSTPVFEAQLAAVKGDCRGIGNINANKLAVDLVPQEMGCWDGPWLACYMLRRFGWPNLGSDDHKEFMSWKLTTPMEGVFMTVTPYMGNSRDKKQPHETALDFTDALHFGCSVHATLAEKTDPIEQELLDHEVRLKQFIQQWWQSKGCQQFALISCHPDENETLVLRVGEEEKEGHVYGFYRRTASMLTNMHHASKKLMTPQEAAAFLDAPMKKNLVCDLHFFFECMEDAEQITAMEQLEIDRASWPQLDRDKVRAQRQENDRVLKEPIRDALRATLRDLLRPTYVRDVYFNAQRRVPDAELETMPTADYFAGAGNTPEYWFTQAKTAAKSE